MDRAYLRPDSYSVEIQRDKDPSNKVTTGMLSVRSGPIRVFMCRTLELPWKNNKRGISCIPVGSYSMRFTKSAKFPRGTWQIMDVPGRSGIRIHTANYLRQLRGCIAPGMRVIDLDGDGLLDVESSRNALDLLHDFLSGPEIAGLAVPIVIR